MTRLSDDQLIRRLEDLSDQERATTLNILLYLGEIERRKLHLRLGHPSMFAFATRHLRYSESAAGRRIQAARTIVRYPYVAKIFRRREVNLSTISMVSRVLNDSNKDQLLAQIRNKSQREVEAIVAYYKPATQIRDRVRPVALRTLEPPANDRVNHSRSGSSNHSGCTSTAGSIPVGSPIRNADSDDAITSTADHSRSGSVEPEEASVAPVSRVEQKFVVQFGARPAFMEKFEEARALLSNRYPRGPAFEKVFESALDIFLERHSPARRRSRRQERQSKRELKAAAGCEASAGQDTKAKADSTTVDPGVEGGLPGLEGTHVGAEGSGTTSLGSKPAGIWVAEIVETRVPGQSKVRRRPDSRYSRSVPVAVRDAVFARNGGRCTYVGAAGQRCKSTFNLEIDHVLPVGRGGTHCVENLRLLCAQHNLLEAERVYGEDWMQRSRAASR